MAGYQPGNCGGWDRMSEENKKMKPGDMNAYAMNAKKEGWKELLSILNHWDMSGDPTFFHLSGHLVLSHPCWETAVPWHFQWHHLCIKHLIWICLIGCPKFQWFRWLLTPFSQYKPPFSDTPCYLISPSCFGILYACGKTRHKFWQTPAMRMVIQ